MCFISSCLRVSEFCSSLSVFRDTTSLVILILFWICLFLHLVKYIVEYSLRSPRS
ncbi:p6a [Mulberry crinivirus]|nr:p6a [Mulberry crinivirus]